MLRSFKIFIGPRLCSKGKFHTGVMIKCLRNAIRQAESLTVDDVTIQFGRDRMNLRGLGNDSFMFSKSRKKHYKSKFWNINVFSFDEVDKWCSDILAEDLKRERETKARNV